MKDNFFFSRFYKEGLVLQAALYTGLGIDVDDVPVTIILILWAVFSAITTMVVDKIGI